jgi:tRNA G18 (ribose-2'-O)-methylase SpoU
MSSFEACACLLELHVSLHAKSVDNHPLSVCTHSSVMTIVKSRPFREKQGKILLEGRRLIADALKAGAVPKAFFFSRLEYVKELPVDKLKDVSLIKVKFEDIKDWSDLVTPQGIMGQ